VWEEIRLEALGVIDEATLEFCPGLTVITGETGAGKTMVVTALGLLRGGRADAGLVRHGSARTRVQARVDVADVPAAADLADAAGAELDDGVLILARTVTADGRSRAFLGGAAVPASTIAAVSSSLVTVHGQSDQHRLLRPAAQRAALDRYGGEPVSLALARYRPAYERLQAIDVALDNLLASEQERMRELDVLRFGLSEVSAVEPFADEDDLLRAEHDRLAHADALREAATLAHDGLAGNDSELRGLVATDDRLIAVGRVARLGAAAWTSQDGINWRRSTKGFRSEPLTVMYGVVEGARSMVAVGQGAMGAAAWTSPDGLHWRREVDGPAMHRGAMRDVVRTPGGLVAVGDNQWTSKDGLRWTSVTEPSLRTPELWAVIATPAGLTAVGNDRQGDGAAWQSVDVGRTWRVAPPQEDLTGGSLFALGTTEEEASAILAAGEAAGNGMVWRTPPATP